jgi:hypothetical protein
VTGNAGSINGSTPIVLSVVAPPSTPPVQFLGNTSVLGNIGPIK